MNALDAVGQQVLDLRVGVQQFQELHGLRRMFAVGGNSLEGTDTGRGGVIVLIAGPAHHLVAGLVTPNLLSARAVPANVDQAVFQLLLVGGRILVDVALLKIIPDGAQVV